jgi:hypothetical protein
MHIWSLHAGSMNSSHQMRMMVNAHFFGRDQKLWSHSRDRQEEPQLASG